MSKADSQIRTEMAPLKIKFHDTESMIRKVGKVIGKGPLTPALNEIRYACHHVFNAIMELNHEDKHVELVEIGVHLNRAKFDTAEIGAMFLLEEIAEYRNRFGPRALSEVMPDYAKDRDQLYILRKKAMDNGNLEDRERVANDEMTVFDELFEMRERFDAARDDARASIGRQRLKIGFAVLSMVLIPVAIAAFNF